MILIGDDRWIKFRSIIMIWNPSNKNWQLENCLKESEEVIKQSKFAGGLMLAYLLPNGSTDRRNKAKHEK